MQPTKYERRNKKSEQTGNKIQSVIQNILTKKSLVTDDVTALPSLHQWFPITLRIPSKLSPWPNLSPDLISLSQSSHRLSPRYFWSTPGMFLLWGFYTCSLLCLAYAGSHRPTQLSPPRQAGLSRNVPSRGEPLSLPATLHHYGKEHPHYFIPDSALVLQSTYD